MLAAGANLARAGEIAAEDDREGRVVRQVEVTERGNRYIELQRVDVLAEYAFALPALEDPPAPVPVPTDRPLYEPEPVERRPRAAVMPVRRESRSKRKQVAGLQALIDLLGADSEESGGLVDMLANIRRG